MGTSQRGVTLRICPARATFSALRSISPEAAPQARAQAEAWDAIDVLKVVKSDVVEKLTGYYATTYPERYIRSSTYFDSENWDIGQVHMPLVSNTFWFNNPDPTNAIANKVMDTSAIRRHLLIYTSPWRPATPSVQDVLAQRNVPLPAIVSTRILLTQHPLTQRHRDRYYPRVRTAILLRSHPGPAAADAPR